MKFKILSLVFIFISCLISAQTYVITKIDGGSVIKNGTTLKAGNSLNVTDDIVFSTLTVKILLINSNTGTNHYIQPQNSLTARVKDVIKTIKSTIIQPKGLYGQTSLKNFLSDNKILFLDTLYVIDIDLSDFPITSTEFYELSYETNNTKYSKRIEYKNKQLIFNNFDFFMSGESENNNITYKLYYTKLSENKKIKICKISPVFSSAILLNEEIKIIVDNNNKNQKTYNEIIDCIYSYLTNYYGVVDLEYLKKWLAVNYGIK